MENFDIIIIGSGMGGLVCGAILSMEGFRVCILEKNQQLGGSLQTYVRDRVIFDSGVHYLGGLEEGQNLYQIFKYIGIIDKLKLQRQDMDVFDKIVIGDDIKEYAFAQGYENFISKLQADFPNEGNALRAYCYKIKEICRKFPLYQLEAHDLNEQHDFTDNLDILRLNTYEYIDSLTSNKKLQQVLAGNNILYAGQADKTPFYVHALIINSYIESSWKCIDGGSQISKYIARNIQGNGGKIIRNCKVKKIIAENGLANCVELSDGTKLYAKNFISNVHPLNTYEMIDPAHTAGAHVARLKDSENSISAFTLNIVFEKDTFKYFKHNYYWSASGHVWTAAEYTQENWPLNYAIFCGASSRSSGYADGISVLTYMRYEEVKPWKDTYNTVSTEQDRGESYSAFKRRKAEALLDIVEKNFPGIRRSIKSYYVATPLSFRDYIGNEDGSLYGIVKDHKQPFKSFVPPQAALPNLYFTGQNLNLHGVLGAAMSGIVTCCALLDSSLIVQKIRDA